MNSRSLIRWSKLEESRRRAHSGGFSVFSSVVLSVVLGGILAAEISRRLLGEGSEEAMVRAASHVWIAAALCAYLLGVFLAPFRLYWRRDSKLLASLSVPGQSLFALTLWRSHRSAIGISLALALGLLPFGLWVDWQLALRHSVPMVIGFIGCAWLGPAFAFAAGSVVASDKAQSMISGMGGEFQPPKTSWLGLFPGLAATALAIAILAAAPWVLGERPPGGSIVLVLLLSLAIPTIALTWALQVAGKLLPAALREVASLDQEILAHVERSKPSWLERSVFGVFLRSGNDNELAHKDASLSRRRYPSPYFVIPIGIVALWVVALSQPENYYPWAGPIWGALHIYTWVMARRCNMEPIEIPSLLRSLPISDSQIARAKRVQSTLRLSMIALFAGIPMVLQAPDIGSAGVFVSLTGGLTLFGLFLQKY